MTANNQRSRAGFTLIELMVVMTLIGIMAAVILPEMKGTFEDAVLRSTGRKLAIAFKLASSQAITGNQLHRVRLDLGKHQYEVEKKAANDRGTGFEAIRDLAGAKGDLDERITIQFRKSEQEEMPKQEETTRPTRNEDQNARRGDSINFYPDGTADPGEIQLKDRDGFRLILRINPTTARVRITEQERE